MGESISEATIISWLKNVGDTVDAEETILEVATDKVDSDVPSPVNGIITEIRFGKNDVVKVGEVLAFIETDGKTAGKKITIGKTEQIGDKGEIASQARNDGDKKQDLKTVIPSATDNSQPTTRNRQLLKSTDHQHCTKRKLIHRRNPKYSGLRH